ncbi:mRNA export factor-like [Octopus sinensis]|uniref:mRNA export factor-like n=1 Tax=Octopus sinensis TaxID=2607531 RepID=A0A6P7TZT9_9MOLL|nr:mRNA export factor-like [Octopus sinensis]
MSFGPNMATSVLLAASSWEASISCYEVTSDRNVIYKAKKTDTQPIFHTCWSLDGKQIYSACGDNFAKLWDLQSDQYVNVAKVLIICIFLAR